MTTEIRITQNNKIIVLIASDSNDISKLLDYIKELPEVGPKLVHPNSLESFFKSGK